MPPVNLLIKPASSLCNMRCTYCFYHDESQKRQQASYGLMSEEILKNVIKKAVLSAEEYCSIAFQGGEPTLIGLNFFKKLIILEKRFNQRNIKINNALQTNGYQLTEEWCRFFKDNNFLIGLSVDGTEEIHNKYRHNQKGEGTYTRVCKSAELMEAHGVEFNILTVVHRETALNIRKIYRNYKERKWMFQQYITCLDPLGEEPGKQEYSLSPEIYGRFLTDLFDLWYEDFMIGKQPYIRQFENYVAILLGLGAESCEQRGTCGIQNTIEADGSVYPCDFYVLDGYCLGNLNNTTMKAIHEKRKEIGFIERSYNWSEACKSCKYFFICRGGCQRNRIPNVQSDGYLNFFCEGYRMFFDACFTRLEQVAAICKKRFNH